MPGSPVGSILAPSAAAEMDDMRLEAAAADALYMEYKLVCVAFPQGTIVVEGRTIPLVPNPIVSDPYNMVLAIASLPIA